MWISTVIYIIFFKTDVLVKYHKLTFFDKKIAEDT